MKHKPYPKYKPSGIDWIGNIPEGWEIGKLSNFSKYQEGPGIMLNDFINEGVPLIRISGMKSAKVSLEGCNYLDPVKVNKIWRQFKLDKDDLLVSASATTGIVSEVDEETVGCVPYTGLIRFKPLRSLNQKYLKYFLISNVFNEQIEIQKTGTTIQHYGPKHLSRVFISVPKLTDQQQIADFLDKKTAQIDELIGKKEEMIRLLKEKRTAVINQAVTCGLDENGSLRQKPENLPAPGWKPSGIEWIGDIPEEWEIFKLKYLSCKIGSGVTPTGGATIYQSKGIPLLRSQNIHFDSLHLDDVVYISEEIHNSMIASEVQEGDVLFNITGASIGRCNYWAEKRGRANVNQHVCIVRPSIKILTKFLWFFLSSDYCQHQMLITQDGSSREGLNFKDFGCFTVILPSKEIQSKIVEFLDNKTSEIDVLIHKIKDAMDRLREYRSSLITAAVTGKIDVRAK